MSKQKTIIERKNIIRQTALSGIRKSINSLNSILCSNYDSTSYTCDAYLEDMVGYDKQRNTIDLPYFNAGICEDTEYRDCLIRWFLSDDGYYFDELNLIPDKEEALKSRTTDYLMHLDRTLLKLVEYLKK